MGARLDGKVAIVTGAGGGIGREHARLFAAEGASVLVNDVGLRRGADAASVVAEIEAAGGSAMADTTSATWDGAADIVQHPIDAFGRLDIVVNNATAARNADLWRVTEEEWDLALGVNLKGYFAIIREAVPHLCGQGAGAIVNTSSGSGFGHPSAVAYASAKEGVVGLTRTVAKELGRFGVRCNAIRPARARRVDRGLQRADVEVVDPHVGHDGTARCPARVRTSRPRSRIHRRRSRRWSSGSAPTPRAGSTGARSTSRETPSHGSVNPSGSGSSARPED